MNDTVVYSINENHATYKSILTELQVSIQVTTILHPNLYPQLLCPSNCCCCEILLLRTTLLDSGSILHWTYCYFRFWILIAFIVGQWINMAVTWPILTLVVVCMYICMYVHVCVCIYMGNLTPAFYCLLVFPNCSFHYTMWTNEEFTLIFIFHYLLFCWNKDMSLKPPSNSQWG